ncbi:hypothetical protein MHU86_24741 [Fragilaria crotonensis]|nr:hypothetical protein MHU86_24741 [Fragilaria crotonensis]
MLAQFEGREEELLQTLRTMQERSVTFRARAAVHKSSGRPPPRRGDGVGYRRDGGAYSVDSRQTGESETSRGSTAGSAAIAAASIPRPATGRVPIHPPPVPAYESRRESDGSSPYSDPSKNSPPEVRSSGAIRREKIRDPSSDGDSDSGSESESRSEEGSYSSGSYTSASGSQSGSYTGSSASRSESYASRSLDDLPNRWKTNDKQPLSKKLDAGDSYVESAAHRVSRR